MSSDPRSGQRILAKKLPQKKKLRYFSVVCLCNFSRCHIVLVKNSSPRGRQTLAAFARDGFSQALAQPSCRLPWTCSRKDSNEMEKPMVDCRNRNKSARYLAHQTKWKTDTQYLLLLRLLISGVVAVFCLRILLAVMVCI